LDLVNFTSLDTLLRGVATSNVNRSIIAVPIVNKCCVPRSAIIKILPVTMDNIRSLMQCGQGRCACQANLVAFSQDMKTIYRQHPRVILINVPGNVSLPKPRSSASTDPSNIGAHHCRRRQLLILHFWFSNGRFHDFDIAPAQPTPRFWTLVTSSL
jgi:hypothetical protein